MYRPSDSLTSPVRSLAWMVATYSGGKCRGSEATACENGSPRRIAATIVASTSWRSPWTSFSASVWRASTRFNPASSSAMSSTENSAAENRAARRALSRMPFWEAKKTFRPCRRASSRAAASLAAVSVSETTCWRASSAWRWNCISRSSVHRGLGDGVHAEIRVLAGAAGLAVAAVGDDLELGLLARDAIDVRPAPRVVRQRLLQVRLDRGQAFLAGRVAPVVEAVLVQRLLQRIDLRARHLHLRLAHLGEVARGYVPGEQADDDDDDEQLEQREAFVQLFHGSLPWLFARYCGIATGPSTGGVDVDAAAVVPELVDPVVLPPTGAPEIQKDALPPTPKLIEPAPDWCAPMSGAR